MSVITHECNVERIITLPTKCQGHYARHTFYYPFTKYPRLIAGTPWKRVRIWHAYSWHVTTMGSSNTVLSSVC